jgi:hypothetical protein
MVESNEITTTECKLTAAQIEKDCPTRLRQIGKEITERLAIAEKQTQLAQDHLIAIEQLLDEAKKLCDGGGFKKFHELFCPKLGKSQAYAMRSIAAGKKTLGEHRAGERDRKRRTRANQKARAADSGTVPEKADRPESGVSPEAEQAPAADVAPEQAPPRRSGAGRKDETRLRGAAASLAAPCFEDVDRRTIRNQHEPYLDGFIDEEGELRFEPAQVPPLSSAEAQAERSIEDCEAVEGGKPTRRRDRIAGKAKAPADVAGTS